MLLSFFKGFLTTAGLITAVGAQNIFVLKQGLMRSHVLLVIITCCTIDAFLIAIGVNGVGNLIITMPMLLHITKYGGALFLFCYGAKALYEAYKGEMTMKIDEANKKQSLKSVILTLLAVSFLNPHTYLDTMVLIGSVGAHLDDVERIFFIVGATFASFLWFTLLCYGARYLAPYFQKASVWRIFNSFVGIIMWGIAFTLVVTE
jgi:L-lysine exporter family protein LysE/ArgO